MGDLILVSKNKRLIKDVDVKFQKRFSIKMAKMNATCI
jgi:hypothetical protein